jgi:RecB family endonuclease NucS
MPRRLLDDPIVYPRATVRILVCRCSIGYAGRLTTRLASGDRVLLFKDDGAVCIHARAGAKPINYMPGPTVVREEDGVIRVTRPSSGETLTILVEEVHDDRSIELEDEARLEREGRELQLHERLVRQPDAIEVGLVVVERERRTDVGPVDLWCRDVGGCLVLVEVKRVQAVAAAVEQVVRYREQALRDPLCGDVRAIVAAPDFAPQARALAEARNVELVRIDVQALFELADAELTLFS